MANQKGKLLVITALHGDETFSSEPVKKVQEQYKDTFPFDVIVGNPKAVEQNVRFTEGDLNRIAPGNPSSEIYEERRAAELVELSKNYSAVIDIHGTNANTGIFTLVTNPTFENLLLASLVPVDNVVIWASKKSQLSGPFTQYAQCPAIEIECGPKNEAIIKKDLEDVLMNFTKNCTEPAFDLMANAKVKNYFYVYGKIEGQDTSDMKEFELFEAGEEEFYPLLINSYAQGSARKMKRVNLFDLLSY